MSDFIVAFDNDQRDTIIPAIKAVPGIILAGGPRPDGTVRIRTSTRGLDEEAAAVHAVEEIEGVIDVRLLDK